MTHRTPTQDITDNRFAVIPHWIVFSGISDGAFRLYAILRKYADSDTLEAFPARSTLARDLGKSADSVDRHAKELVGIGALKITRRKRKGTNQNYTNLYTLISANPNAPEVPDVLEVENGEE
ncbi:MAG: helix-turn-helix domain-containing protein, partial [Galactobacter sp.]